MSDLGKEVVKFLDSHKIGIIKDARLRGKLVRWDGRYQHGDETPAGTAVIYLDKIMVALVDGPKPDPQEGAEGWGLMVDLTRMRVNDAPWVNRPAMRIPVDESNITKAVVGALVNNSIAAIQQKVLGEPMPGVFRWVGVYHWENDYQQNDMVAYNRGLYVALTGEGTPGYGDGWRMLDYVTVGGFIDHLVHPAIIPDAAKDTVVIPAIGEITATDPKCGWSYSVNGAPFTAFTLGGIGTSPNELTLVMAAEVVCGDIVDIKYEAGGCDLAIGGELVPDYEGGVKNALRSPVPVVTVQPTSQEVTEPDPATFSLTATGADSYQWFRNGEPVPGETGDSYTVDPTVYVPGADPEFVFCNIENKCGQTQSDVVTLTINRAPLENEIVYLGESVTYMGSYITYTPEP